MRWKVNGKLLVVIIFHLKKQFLLLFYCKCSCLHKNIAAETLRSEHEHVIEYTSTEILYEYLKCLSTKNRNSLLYSLMNHKHTHLHIYLLYETTDYRSSDFNADVTRHSKTIQRFKSTPTQRLMLNIICILNRLPQIFAFFLLWQYWLLWGFFSPQNFSDFFLFFFFFITTLNTSWSNRKWAAEKKQKLRMRWQKESRKLDAWCDSP